jgi:hypothetical protein
MTHERREQGGGEPMKGSERIELSLSRRPESETAAPVR